jgi:hypothetical protein
MSLLEKMPETAKERWRTAGRFADVLEIEVKARGSPLIARVVTWFNLCRLCQDLEEQLLLTPQPLAEDLLLYRALLSVAIGAGEGLLLECTDPRPLEPLGITPDCIDAKIESLRITFDQWHTESKPEHREAVLKEVFGGEA